MDALYLSARGSLPKQLADELEAGRARAAECRQAQPFELGAEKFHLLARGFHKFRYCLQHENGPVGLTTSERLPVAWVQPRSEFLHSVGPANAVEWYRSALSAALGSVEFTVSRLDLHADWEGWDLCGDDRHRFACRADDLGTYEEAEEFSGFVFGRKTTATVLARIYDKTREVEAKGGDWWLERWGEISAGPVIRTEFQLGRQGLREFGVDTPEEALARLGDLWGYCTEKWLTHRDPTRDQTKSRWPVSEQWTRIQNATLRGETLAATRIQQGLRRGSLRKLMPQLNGCLVGFAAIVGTFDIEDTLGELVTHLDDYAVASRRSFAGRVVDRKLEQLTR